MQPPWVIYENAARRVLGDIRQELGITSVEGKQTLEGNSGASWEVDARALKEGSEGFLLVEVRRHTSSGVKQEAVAAIAYRIQDLGGSGGIIVSPLPLQEGAQRVAASTDIAHVLLSPDSSPENYLAEFMGRRFLSATVSEIVHFGSFFETDAAPPRDNDT